MTRTKGHSQLLLACRALLRQATAQNVTATQHPTALSLLQVLRFGAMRNAHSTRTEAEAAARAEVDDHLDMPGARIPYTPKLSFVGGPDSPAPTLPCYRTIDSQGQDVEGAHVPHPLDKVGTTVCLPG